MQVRLKVSRAGLDPKGYPTAQQSGDVIDVSNDEAKRLFEAGQAEPVGRAPRERAEKRSAPKAKKPSAPKKAKPEPEKPE